MDKADTGAHVSPAKQDADISVPVGRLRREYAHIDCVLKLLGGMVADMLESSAYYDAHDMISWPFVQCCSHYDTALRPCDVPPTRLASQAQEQVAPQRWSENTTMGV